MRAQQWWRDSQPYANTHSVRLQLPSELGLVGLLHDRVDHDTEVPAWWRQHGEWAPARGSTHRGWCGPLKPSVRRARGPGMGSLSACGDPYPRPSPTRRGVHVTIRPPHPRLLQVLHLGSHRHRKHHLRHLAGTALCLLWPNTHPHPHPHAPPPYSCIYERDRTAGPC